MENGDWKFPPSLKNFDDPVESGDCPGAIASKI
jgi:hypothetical protein